MVLIYSEIFFIIRSYAQKKEIHQILAKSVNIYPPNLDLEIFHGIYTGEITQKQKICITFSIFISFILFPWTKMCMVCLKYIHSQKLKIFENFKMAKFRQILFKFTRVNAALTTLGRVHFALVTIVTMPPLVHNLLLNVFSGIDFSSRREFSFMSSIDWKRVHRSGNLSFGKRKKSAGATLGEYSCYMMIFVAFLARNSLTMIALWDGALSWCNIHEFSFYKSDLFRRICSLKRFITLK